MAWITTPERTRYDWHAVPSDELPSDSEIKAVLVSRLNENLYTQDSEIRVEVSDRTVRLDGDVDSPIARRVAADDAWDVPGVVEVDNCLSVAS